MKDNPFTSGSFVKPWANHFLKKQTPVVFESIDHVKFYKSKIPNLYINCGRNLTKGIFYNLPEVQGNDWRKKIFLIYDVPTYFKIADNNPNKNLKLQKIKQYPGFLIELENYKDINGYMTATFNKSSRYKLNKYKKRLELCFDIHYKMFYGNISRKEYDFVFEHFKNLLNKRFVDKEISNNNLDPKEWDFYYDIAYPMILKKKASLFVIYDGETPIGITLNYLNEDILFDAITVFDIDYSKFHLGSITIMKLIEWCLENNINILDFSKGYFDYKKRWGNKEYDFEYHLLYDARSLLATAQAFFITKYFVLKQFLRKKNINKVLHRVTFFLSAQRKSPSHSIAGFKFTEPGEKYDATSLIGVNFHEEQNLYLKQIVFEFLYLYSEALKDITCYKIKGTEESYLITGKICSQKIVLG